MADQKKQPTHEEIDKQRKEQRNSALKTFKGKLVDLAAAFYVENSNQYGEAGASAVDEFIYRSAIKSEEGSKLLYDNLFGSRQSGKRYTGNVSEYQILQYAVKIVQESLGALNINDLYGLMGSKAKTGEGLENAYISDLMNSGNKEAKDFGNALMGTYVANLMDIKVAEALTKKAKARVSSLEKMLVQEDEPKKEQPKGKK